MEILDICDPQGRPTGAVISRSQAHRDGVLHRTSHVWVVRRQAGNYQVLLQKRSAQKDSYPGVYDASAAGHIPAGDDPLTSILREMEEEIGLRASPDQLHYAGFFRCTCDSVFHQKPFRDDEIRFAYVYEEPVDSSSLHLQESEVESVAWFDVAAVYEEIQTRNDRICVSVQGLGLLMGYLGMEPGQAGISSAHSES